MAEKTQNKKKIIYYSILAACALLLIAGIVLTVYFVTRNAETVSEDPPIVDSGDQNDPPAGGEIPGGEIPGGEEPGGQDEPDDPPASGGEEPGEPSGGEDAVRFVAPIDYEDYSVVYADIYHNETTGWWYRHKAVDFEAPAGTEVRCMADGTIESVSVSQELGNLIIVDHGDGLKTLYRFVEPVGELAAGQKVSKGEKLGEVATAYGSEARDGEHLHLEIVLNGDYVDPTDYLEPVLEEK